jgi:hypothetical protein
MDFAAGHVQFGSQDHVIPGAALSQYPWLTVVNWNAQAHRDAQPIHKALNVMTRQGAIHS